jgi:hypothetical protein
MDPRGHAGPTQAHRPLPNIIVAASNLPTPPFAYMAEPAFALVAQGAKRVVLGNQVFDYAAGPYLTYSVDLPLSGHVVQASATRRDRCALAGNGRAAKGQDRAARHCRKRLDGRPARIRSSGSFGCRIGRRTPP